MLSYSGPERRKYKRIIRNYIAKFQRVNINDPDGIGSAWEMVVVQNLSAGGVLFHYNQAIDKDTIIKLKINFPLTETPIETVGRINRLEIQEKAVIVGLAAHFIDIPPNDMEVINNCATDLSIRKPERISQ